MNDEEFVAKMATLHHRFWLQSDAERLIAFANDSLLLRAGMKDQRAAEKYAADNPLGGPANMFDAIASRIRAGEEYYAVLDDYDITVNVRERKDQRPDVGAAGVLAAVQPMSGHPTEIALAEQLAEMKSERAEEIAVRIRADYAISMGAKEAIKQAILKACAEDRRELAAEAYTLPSVLAALREKP